MITGSMITNTCFNIYIYLSTASLVRTEGIVTSLVFDHALRIRLKAETGEKKETDSAATPAGSDRSAKSSGASSPEPASTSEEDGDIKHNTAKHDMAEKPCD